MKWSDDPEYDPNMIALNANDACIIVGVVLVLCTMLVAFGII